MINKKAAVYEINSVELSVLEADPPKLAITAFGSAATPGWTLPELHRRRTINPPEDAIDEYDLIAQPPLGESIQVVTPLKEPARLLRTLPLTLRGVRVHGTHNAVERLVPEWTRQAS